jgi:hypothetical protein
MKRSTHYNGADRVVVVVCLWADSFLEGAITRRYFTFSAHDIVPLSTYGAETGVSPPVSR